MDPRYQGWESDKSSCIRNSVFCYIQKVLASSVLAQHGTGNARRLDMGIIMYMLKGMIVNFSALPIEQFKSQAKTGSTAIGIGGMVTPITIYLGIILVDIPPQVSYHKVGMSELKGTHFLTVLSFPNGTLYFIQHNEDHFPLPNPILPNVSTMEARGN